MWIKRQSAISGIERTRNIPVNPDDFFLWKNGEGSVEDLMPYLTDSDRDFILSGITGDEWDDIFSQSVEDELADDEAAF